MKIVRLILVIAMVWLILQFVSYNDTGKFTFWEWPYWKPFLWSIVILLFYKLARHARSVNKEMKRRKSIFERGEESSEE